MHVPLIPVPLVRPAVNSSPMNMYSCARLHVSMQANDFGSEVIPGAKDLGMHVQAYLYDGYWEDIGTIEAFYQANLALTKNPKPDYRSVLPDIHDIAGQLQQCWPKCYAIQVIRGTICPICLKVWSEARLRLIYKSF